MSYTPPDAGSELGNLLLQRHLSQSAPRPSAWDARLRAGQAGLGQPQGQLGGGGLSSPPPPPYGMGVGGGGMSRDNYMVTPPPFTTPTSPLSGGTDQVGGGGPDAGLVGSGPGLPDKPPVAYPNPDPKIPPAEDRFDNAQQIQDAYRNGWNPNPVLLRAQLGRR